MNVLLEKVAHISTNDNKYEDKLEQQANKSYRNRFGLQPHQPAGLPTSPIDETESLNQHQNDGDGKNVDDQFKVVKALQQKSGKSTFSVFCSTNNVISKYNAKRRDKDKARSSETGQRIGSRGPQEYRMLNAAANESQQRQVSSVSPNLIRYGESCNQELISNNLKNEESL